MAQQPVAGGLRRAEGACVEAEAMEPARLREGGRRGHPQPQHPGVHDRLGPVLVGPERDPGPPVVTAPGSSPGVQDQKARLGIAHHKEGVAGAAAAHGHYEALPVAGLLRIEGAVPALVDLGRNQERADIGQRRMPVVQAGQHAIVGAERHAARGLRPFGGQRIRTAPVGPEALGADAVMVEALQHGAERGHPAARASVLHQRHPVEHPRGHARRGRARALVLQIDQRREGLTGAALGLPADRGAGRVPPERQDGSSVRGASGLSEGR